MYGMGTVLDSYMVELVFLAVSRPSIPTTPTMPVSNATIRKLTVSFFDTRRFFIIISFPRLLLLVLL